MRRSIAHVHAFVLAAVALIAGASSCSRSWQLPGSGVDAAASGGRGDGGAALGGTSGAAGAPGGGGVGASGSGGLGAFGGAGFGASGGSAFPWGTGGGAGCDSDKIIDVTPHTADVMLVVGRDSSMAAKFADGPSRMMAVRDAIMTTLTNPPAGVAFGYQDFPALSGCFPQSPCCLGPWYTNPMGFTSTSKFQTEYGPCSGSGSGSGTPSGDSCVSLSDARPVSQALESVLDIFRHTSDSSSLDFFVVLVVDGAPGCFYESPEPSDCVDEPSTVSALRKMGAKVFVVPIGDDAAINDPCLKTMAYAAGTNPLPPGAPPLQPATDVTKLKATLSTIANLAGESLCTLDIPPNHRPADNSTVKIVVGANQVGPHDSSNPDGWAFTGDLRIKLYGDSCTKLRRSPYDLKVTAGCR